MENWAHHDNDASRRHRTLANSTAPDGSGWSNRGPSNGMGRLRLCCWLALFLNPHLLEQRYASLSIISFQQIAGPLPVGLLEQS
jgi:hypothetical protein